MKRKLLFIPILFACAYAAPGADIAWVSFHPADETPTANAANWGFTNAPDAGYTALLRANGHNVVRFVTSDTPDVASLNTNDLVILSRSVPSGHYELDAETAAWNGITAPMIIVNGYLTRNTRLGLTTGGTMVDANSTEVRLRASVPAHPVFAGVSLDSSNLMVNAYARRMTIVTNQTTGGTTLQNGISVNNNTLIGGGSIIGVVGTAGDAAVNGTIVAEFPPGLSTSTSPADVLGARRLMVLTGSREANGVSSEGAGVYDLLPDGEKVFLNAVNYLTGNSQPVVVALNPLVGTNLYAGDWWTFTPTAFGSDPLSYQWYKGQNPIPGATAPTLSFTNLTLGDAGEYFVVVSNPQGSATSAVGRLEFAVPPGPNIIDGMIAYWPLDVVVGTRTPDLVSGYDMTLVNMGTTNIDVGKWGNAFRFDNAAQNSLERLNQPGDDLPIYQFPAFTVSLWVNGFSQTDHRVFSEGSTSDTDPLFNIGTDNRATPDVPGTVDIYVRNDTAGTVGDHRHSTAVAFDGGWHNIVYAQRDAGDGLMKAQLFVDGVLDSVQITPVRPLTANATAIGAIRRASASAWFTGMIDEVALWNRALTAQEIQSLQNIYITNPPSRVQPLVIRDFRSDTSAVASNGVATLRWDVSKDAAQVTISGLGNVTARTIAGVGSTNIVLNNSTTFVLTIDRGFESLSATTSVAVVNGVAPGWALLDNFDQYTTGSLFAQPYWSQVTPLGAEIVSVGGNPAVRTITGSSVSYLDLRDLTVLEEQARTLFFRIIAGPPNATTITNIVGLTDKSQRNYTDSHWNVGPVLYPTALTNEPAGGTTNSWFLGARNGWLGNNASNPIDYPPPALEGGAVYNVWIDITNAPISWSMSDTYTVYLQKEGDPNPRAVLFQDYMSDRDLFYVDVVLGGATPNLDKLVVLGNSGTYSATFDDFYLSTGGYNATVPRPYGYTGPVQAGTLSVDWVGSQLEIRWDQGVLQHSSSVTGGWEDVPGNPQSPYPVAPTGAGMFYRTRN